MSISFIAFHSYSLKYVAPWGQNTSRWALYPTLAYLYSCEQKEKEKKENYNGLTKIRLMAFFLV